MHTHTHLLFFSYSVLEECEVNICQNNATCSKQVLTYTCTCPAEYTGSLCQDKGLYMQLAASH